MKKKNAFTLIELIAVLVILAVIALIVTPLVLNIVKKAKDSANKRSVDAYGKATELAVATYLLDNGDYPTTIDDLTVEYSGNEVICNVKNLNADGSIYLSECSVAKSEVKDVKTEDGYYHYGEYRPYISYKIGDQIAYNGVKFYVIAPSDANTNSVMLLKAEPLSVDEVNKYGTDGNGVNHVNRYTKSSVGTAYNIKDSGYGGMAYYSSPTCGYATTGSAANTSGCTNENANSYETSDVKYVVDNWATDKFNLDDLKEDALGYKARLLTYEELTTTLGYVSEEGKTHMDFDAANTPSWVNMQSYYYWTMSPYVDSSSATWFVHFGSDTKNPGADTCSVYYGSEVRPVITLLKSAI